MQPDEIVESCKYKVVYVDNNLVKLALLNKQHLVYFETKSDVGDCYVGDIVTKYFNRTKRKYFFVVTQSGTKVAEPIDKALEGLYQENNIDKNKIQEISKWIVFCMKNHSICLANLFDFSEKRYIPDIDLLLNAQVGDIYFYLDDGKSARYIYSEDNNDGFCIRYASFLGDFRRAEEAQGKVSQEKQAQEKLKEYIAEHEKLFKSKVKQEFINTYYIESLENEIDGYDIFRLLDKEENDIAVSSKDLPKYAKEGDYVGLTKENKFEYDRVSLISDLNYLEQLSKKCKGGVR